MIIIAIIGMILAGLIYLLYVPVHLKIGYNIERNSLESGVIKLYPFTYRIRPTSSQDLMSKKQHEQEEQNKKNKIKMSVRYIQLMRTEPEMLKQAAFNSVRFIHRIVIMPHCHLNACITGGFSEPNITGFFYGGLCAIQPMAGESLNISYTPDFTKDALCGKVTACLVVRLIGIIREILVFIWRLPVLRLLKFYFKQRRHLWKTN